MSENGSPCPCCGYQTLVDPQSDPPPRCPICCWPISTSGAVGNRTKTMPLWKAQENYSVHGVCNPKWRKAARKPWTSEHKAPGFVTQREQEQRARTAISELIFTSFSELRRGDGMRIYDAELADSYRVESPKSNRAKHITYQLWQEIPDSLIEEFYGVLPFFDEGSFQFHLPAYMTWTLNNFITSVSMTPSHTVYALWLNAQEKDLNRWKKKRFEAFTLPQKQATAAFLRHLATYGTTTKDAQAALDLYWARFESKYLLF
jgi:hypothetical protein